MQSVGHWGPPFVRFLNSYLLLADDLEWSLRNFLPLENFLPGGEGNFLSECVGATTALDRTSIRSEKKILKNVRKFIEKKYIK